MYLEFRDLSIAQKHGAVYAVTCLDPESVRFFSPYLCDVLVFDCIFHRQEAVAGASAYKPCIT